MVVTAPDTTTRERLLEKAAELFADRGFDSVSLRDLTQAAGVNLAAVNYHFGSKEKLIESLIAGMVNALNEERLMLLDRARAGAGDGVPDVETVLRAFLEPVVKRVKQSAMSEQLFFKLMARCLTDRAQQFPEAMMPQLERVVKEFGAALRHCAPSLDEGRILWRLNFTVSALLNTLMNSELLERLGRGVMGPITGDAILSHLLEFCVAGFREEERESAADVKKARLHHVLRLAPVLASALFLASCAAISPQSRMGESAVTVPGSWAASKAGKAGVDTDWLRRFNDSRLTAVVDEAIRNNHDLKMAAARVEKARGQAKLAGVASKPTIDLTTQGNRSKQNFIGFPIGGPDGGGGGVTSSQFNAFDLSVAIKWEIDVWGRIAAGKSAAKASYEAAQLDEQAARASVAANVAKAWFSLAEAQAQLRLARESQQVFEDTATAVRERFQAGDEVAGSAAQLRLSETDVANAKATVMERQQQVAAATRQLEALLGRYPSGEMKSATELPSVPSPPPVGLPSELLQRRPDVLAAERRFAAAGKRLSEARRAIFPRLSLTASGGTSTEELADLLNSEFGVWQLAGNLVQPIFAAGAIKGEADVRYADEKEILTNLQKTVINAFSEVEVALVSERYLSGREAAITEASQLAADADKAARADYRDGVGDILTVLAAQARHLQSRVQALAVRRLRLENRVNLHLALGGDYQIKSAK
jgi:NodT family efflux transporter outer membrane factor (OMF) lipoprotein